MVLLHRALALKWLNLSKRKGNSNELVYICSNQVRVGVTSADLEVVVVPCRDVDFENTNM